MNPEIEKYVPVADMIAETFGDHCEVVLHDLSQPQSSVVYIKNNVVTHRSVGESFTENFVTDVLLSRKFNNDMSANYMMEGEDGKKIKSSTVLIRNSNGKVVGSMCVNLDITYMSELLSSLSSMFGIQEPARIKQEEVEVMPNIAEIVTDIIDKTIGERDASSMSREQKIEVIRFLNERGIFLIKGMIDQVAERMGISKVTIYGYLDEIKKS